MDLSDALGTASLVLLDTCVLIGAFHGQSDDLAILKRVPRPQLGTSIVVLGEFLTRKKPPMAAAERQHRRRWIRDHGIRTLDFGPKANTTYRALLNRTTIASGLADGLIAAHAISSGHPLLTRNGADFSSFKALKLVRLL